MDPKGGAMFFRSSTFFGIGAAVIALLLAGSHVLDNKSELGPETISSKKDDASHGNTRILGRLKTKNETLTILATPQGMRFTVMNNQGEILLNAVEAKQLCSDSPHLYKLFDTAVAQKGWAGLDAVYSEPNLNRTEADRLY